eukprot:Pgem_evm1s12578
MSCPDNNWQKSLTPNAYGTFGAIGIFLCFLLALTIPILIRKTYTSYTQGNPGNRTIFKINLTYNIMNICYVMAMSADYIFMLWWASSCSFSSVGAVERLGRMLGMYFSTSISLVFLVRFYTFIESMNSANPHRFELK